MGDIADAPVCTQWSWSVTTRGSVFNAFWFTIYFLVYLYLIIRKWFFYLYADLENKRQFKINKKWKFPPFFPTARMCKRPERISNWICFLNSFVAKYILKNNLPYVSFFTLFFSWLLSFQSSRHPHKHSLRSFPLFCFFPSGIRHVLLWIWKKRIPNCIFLCEKRTVFETLERVNYFLMSITSSYQFTLFKKKVSYQTWFGANILLQLH